MMDHLEVKLGVTFPHTVVVARCVASSDPPLGPCYRYSVPTRHRRTHQLHQGSGWLSFSMCGAEISGSRSSLPTSTHRPALGPLSVQFSEVSTFSISNMRVCCSHKHKLSDLLVLWVNQRITITCKVDPLDPTAYWGIFRPIVWLFFTST